MSVGFRSLLAGVLGRYEGLAALPVTTIADEFGTNARILNIWGNVQHSIGEFDRDAQIGENDKLNNIGSSGAHGVGVNDNPGE